MLNTVFDYPEIYYINGDPLAYLLVKELNQNLRFAFSTLTDIDKQIIQELFFSEKSVKDILFKYDMKNNELEIKVKQILENLYKLFCDGSYDYLY